MPKIFVSPLRAAILFLLLLAPYAVHAQERWQWPEPAKNLKVLAPDTSAADLRSTMFSFTQGLDVRCVHCHAGEEGQSLSEIDFASDENPNKDRAREMLRMVHSIDEHLAKIEPSEPERVTVGCGTCHHGRPRPTSLEAELETAYRDGGAAAATARYRELREQFYGRGALDFSENALMGFAFQLIRTDDLDGGIALLRLNTEEHPDSSFAWDGLAEAYNQAGHPEQAEVLWQKSLQLDPGNEHAVAQLRQLRMGDQPAGDPP